MSKRASTAGLLALVATPSIMMAGNGEPASYFSNPLFNALLAVIFLLGLVIIVLGASLRTYIGSELFTSRLREKASEVKAGKGSVLFLIMFLSAAAQAKGQAVSDNIGGLPQNVFYTMISVIALEALVLVILYRTFSAVLGDSAAKKVPAPLVRRRSIIEKVNATVTIEEEASITLDHEYDGIRELDNVLPPWWKYGFYLTILVAIVYLVAYHVTDSLPLQKEEYETSLQKAEAEVAEYMKNSAANVDETTVQMLADPNDLAAGKDIFKTTCAACHGRFGEGGVGPNLTDDYWLHKGGLTDIFKSIKYGWPDKGMKSWKDDFSPMQIAQLTSYIKSLQGSNPPNAKEKQGEPYIEESPASDSLAVRPDSSSRLTSALPR